MKKSKEFNNVLNECLERLVKGETIEQCLQSYPEQANGLKPLLQMALAAKETLAIQPRPEFRAKARYQFYSALQEVKPERNPFFGWLPRWATVVAIVLALLLAGGGTAAAASNSMPDNPLYSVKLATEQVQLTLTPSDIGKAKLCARLADRRVAEIIYVANKGDAKRAEVITQRLDKRLVMLTRLVSAPKAGGEPVAVPQPVSPPKAKGSPKALGPLPEESGESREALVKADSQAKLRITIAHYAANHPNALRAELEKAPESVKPALRRAIAVSVAGYEKVLKALD